MTANFRRGAEATTGSTGYSPILRLVTSNGLTHHLQKPDGVLCCGRHLRLTGPVLAAREYMEQWGDWMVCIQCIARVGAYGPLRASGRPHLSECPAYRGQPCICDEVPYPDDADSG